MSERKRGSRLSNFVFAVFCVTVVGGYGYCVTPAEPEQAPDAGQEDAGALVRTLDAALDEQEARAGRLDATQWLTTLEIRPSAQAEGWSIKLPKLTGDIFVDSSQYADWPLVIHIPTRDGKQLRVLVIAEDGRVIESRMERR